MDLSTSSVLVTGAAGFIGSHVAYRLLQLGARVTGFDNLNSYYDPALKRARLERLQQLTGFHFEEVDLAHNARTAELFAVHQCPRVIHLAAQPGVRHSMTDPHAYVDANIVGFLNVL